MIFLVGGQVLEQLAPPRTLSSCAHRARNARAGNHVRRSQRRPLGDNVATIADPHDVFASPQPILLACVMFRRRRRGMGPVRGLRQLAEGARARRGDGRSGGALGLGGPVYGGAHTALLANLGWRCDRWLYRRGGCIFVRNRWVRTVDRRKRGRLDSDQRSNELCRGKRPSRGVERQRQDKKQRRVQRDDHGERGNSSYPPRARPTHATLPLPKWTAALATCSRRTGSVQEEAASAC